MLAGSFDSLKRNQMKPNETKRMENVLHPKIYRSINRRLPTAMPSMDRWNKRNSFTLPLLKIYFRLADLSMMKEASPRKSTALSMPCQCTRCTRKFENLVRFRILFVAFCSSIDHRSQYSMNVGCYVCRRT